MGAWIKLKSRDGFELSAWRAAPAGKPRGGVVVVQEIFGVNSHIRSVCHRLAEAGYLAIAPGIFDRVEPGFDVGYDAASRDKGMAILGKFDRAGAEGDCEAALAAASEAGKTAIVGFCLGGTYAWLGAAKMPGLSAAVGYYGGGVLGAKDLKPKAPTLLHFGEKDAHIPVSGVREVAALHPDVPVHIYPADHGFNCDERAAFHAESAAIAWGRTIEFLARHLA